MLASLHAIAAICAAGYVMFKLMDWLTDGGDPPFFAFLVTIFMVGLSLITR